LNQHPTGKIHFDETKYQTEVIAPGTAFTACSSTSTVEPVLQRDGGSIYYINLSQDDFKLGGSSLAQTLNTIGKMQQQLKMLFSKAFNTMQELILTIKSGHIACGSQLY
jgi:phosphoribosylformylglycinamidine synthase